MQDPFRPNQLIELELNTSDQSEHRDAYTSRIEEVLPQSLIVAAPIKYGNLVAIAPGSLITLRVHNNGILYSAPSRVQSRSNKGIAVLQISKPKDLTKVQLRSWVRIELLLPIGYRMAGYPIDYYQGLTADLSGGGIMLVTSHPIDVDTLLELQLKLTNEFTLECLGRVTRCLKDENINKRYKVGIRFEDVDEPTVERIVAFVFLKQRESLKKGNLNIK
ncbi:MAG: flagellar brake protein [Methylocystaceae bacterium]